MSPKWLETLLRSVSGHPADEPAVESFKQKFPQFFAAGAQAEPSTSPTPPTQANDNDAASSPEVLPLLPLKDLVLMPEMLVPVVVGRPESVHAVETALGLADPQLAVFSQRDAEKTHITPFKDLYPIGMVATIEQYVRLPDGSIRVLLQGLERIERLEIIEDRETGQSVRFRLVEDTPIVDDIGLEAAKRYLTTQLTFFLQSLNYVPEELIGVLENIDEIERYCYLIAAFLPIPQDQKQLVLETLDPIIRLRQVGASLTKEQQITNINREIQNKATTQLKQVEREYLLKEQLKVIQEELKTTGGEEAQDEYLIRLKAAKVPAAVEKQIRDEIKRLEKIPTYSPEAGLIRLYVEFLLDLPWTKKTKESINLAKVKAILDRDHYGLEKVKERIIEYLAVRKLAPTSRNPILCFVGPPGTGKTTLAKSVAEALGREFARISLGGVRDEAEIRGHRRTYIGALPGRIIKAMKTAEVINPVILLDEIDKMDSDLRGDPTAALLEVLDAEQNANFTDHFLEVPYDLSHVMFITTANVLYSIPEPLVDRLEVIQLSSYTEEEKVQIATHHLVPRQIKEHGLGGKSEPTFTSAILAKLIDDYTREAGVRQLEQQLAKICRKIAHTVVDKKTKPAASLKITGEQLVKFLGPAKFKRDPHAHEDQIGLATGLAWTEVGGEVLPIEVATMPGKGNLTITGQLGEVMQESAKAALSYIRAREKQFHLPKNLLEKFDLHIHVPEGAVPKDGPSAGIAIASAIVSALTKRPVSGKVAMTGEITLRGRVLPIGGLKEKLLAAHRAGLYTVIIPEPNQAELEELPKPIRDKLDIVLVQNMDDVIKRAIVGKA